MSYFGSGTIQQKKSLNLCPRMSANITSATLRPCINRHSETLNCIQCLQKCIMKG